MIAICPCCGCGSLRKRRGSFHFAPPGKVPASSSLVPDAEWLQCEACQKRIVPYQLVRRLELLRYDTLGLLRPSQIRAARRGADLSQNALASLLGVDLKTYRRWESGRSYHSKVTDRAIRGLRLQKHR